MNARRKKIELLVDGDILLFANFPEANQEHLALVLRELAPDEYVVHTYDGKSDSFSDGYYVTRKTRRESRTDILLRARQMWVSRMTRLLENWVSAYVCDFEDRHDDIATGDSCATCGWAPFDGEGAK